jgi:hypothetical protein
MTTKKTLKKSAKKSTKKPAVATEISTVTTAFEVDSSELPKKILKKLDQHLRSNKSQTKIIAKALEEAGLGIKVAAQSSAARKPKGPKKPPKEPHPRVIIIHVRSIPRP